MINIILNMIIYVYVNIFIYDQECLIFIQILIVILLFYFFIEVYIYYVYLQFLIYVLLFQCVNVFYNVVVFLFRLDVMNIDLYINISGFSCLFIFFFL